MLGPRFTAFNPNRVRDLPPPEAFAIVQAMFAATPFPISGQNVLPDWIDYNGHMNVGFYSVAFDRAFDKVCEALDLSFDYVRRTNGSIFVLETHVTYQQEVKQGDPLAFTFQMLDADDKRMHFFMVMRHEREGFVAATSEQLALHVDLGARRAAAFPEEQRRRVSALRDAHRSLPRPAEVGRIIGIRRKDRP